MLRLNLCMSKIRGQCYDGASVMTGVKSGVVAKLNAADLELCSLTAMGMH